MSEVQSGIQMDGVIEQITQGLYEKKLPGVYSPTLIIGLGGTGIKVLRLVKQHLTSHTSRFVRILGIDSDGLENERETNYLPVKLEQPPELAILEADPAISNLARARANRPPGYRFILDYLPEKHDRQANLHVDVRQKIEMQQGAGQFRRAGKLLFGANVSEGAGLSARISKIRNELTEVSTRMEQEIAGFKKAPGFEVFVVCSVAGGTGSGCLVDCLALLRRHFNGNQDRVRVVAVLPGPALDHLLQVPMKEKPGIRGNALGCLRELQAYNLGQVKPAIFQFGPGDSVDLSGLPLANNVYLVDNTQKDGTPLSDWHMVCRAAGYFLYSLVGTGVGMTQAGGLVNAFGIGQGAHGAFGVAVLKYPVHEMALYATRYAVEQYFSMTLAPDGESPSKAQIGEAERILGQLQQNLGVATLSQVRSQMSLGAVPECRYASSTEEQKRLLGEVDRIFLGKARNKYNNVDAELARYAATQKKKVEDLSAKAAAAVEALARREASVSICSARVALETAHEKIKQLISEVARVQQDTRATLDTTLKKFSGKRGLEAKIDFWDFGLDRGLRRKYLAEVQRFLALSQQLFEDGYVGSLLASISGSLGTWKSKMENLEATCQNLRNLNQNEMEKTDRRQNRPGLVQHALAYSQFKDWAASLEFSFVTGFDANLSQISGFLRTALEPVGHAVRQSIESLNLPDAVKKNPDLQKLVRSLNIAGSPLITLTDTAPGDRALAPQKYVAADLGDEKERKAFLSYFTPVGGEDKAVNHVESVDRHTVIMVTTVHGFAVSDWRGFAEAQRYYQDNEWYYGTLPEKVVLPELAIDGAMETGLLRKFGLGLAMGAIAARGANFYVNLQANMDDRGSNRFLAPIDNPGPSVQHLIDTGLVRTMSAEAAGRKLGEMTLLANGTVSAFAAFRDSQWDEFRQAIDHVFRLWRGKSGDISVAAVLYQYVNEDLTPQLGKATDGSDREELLNKLIKIMTALCEELDPNITRA